jgi:O-methyltransferase
LAESLTFVIEDILEHRVEGGFMETGVWTGAQSMVIAAILRAHGVYDREQWLCDSFTGLPRPDAARFPADAGDKHWTLSRHALGGPALTKSNFQQAGLLSSEHQHWEVGFFNDTMPSIMHRASKLALLRLDGDMYQSTWEVLVAMYPKLQVGGYVVVDDYDLRGCTRAVDEFRARFGITEAMRFPKLPVFGRPGAPFVEMLHQGAYWRKERRVHMPYKELQRSFPHAFPS